MPSISDGFNVDQASRTAIEVASKLTWSRFVDTVFELDRTLVDEGVRPHARPLGIAERINNAAGNQIIFSANWRDPVSDGVHALLRAVYGERALGMGPIHVGVIMIRDAFIPFYVPGGYGKMNVQPWDFVDKGPANLDALAALSAEDTARASDQIMDVWDFGWMVDDNRMGEHYSNRLLNQARDQIESACMTLQGSFSQRIAVQGTAYAVELAAKALLSKRGWTKTRLSSLSHNLTQCLGCVADEYENLDRNLVLYSATQIPHVIKERYGENNDRYSRRRVGETVAFGQYVLGELGRVSSDRNLRAGMSGSPERVFPVKPPSA